MSSRRPTSTHSQVCDTHQAEPRTFVRVRQLSPLDLLDHVQHLVLQRPLAARRQASRHLLDRRGMAQDGRQLDLGRRGDGGRVGAVDGAAAPPVSVVR
jgi:hypothetical protein